MILTASATAVGEEISLKVKSKTAGASDKVQLYYSQLHLGHKIDIGKGSRHKWSHQIKRGNTLFPRSRGCMVYKRD